MTSYPLKSLALASLSWIALSCSSSKSASTTEGASAAQPEVREEACSISGDEQVDFVQHIGCRADFDALASTPIDENLPGARSVKVVLDQLDGDALYFQNSQKFQIHYQFVSTHLSGGERPVVPQLSEFNQQEYYQPDRRFILGAVTYYEGPKVWAFELAPYDTAGAEMMTKVMTQLREAAYFGPALVFHPTSEAVEVEARKLAGVTVMTTDDLYAQTEYQPLTLGRTVGKLHFVKAADLETEYLGYRDVVVLDEVPNDISVVSGLITEQFQTPLSHVNVLSQNRHTPNMGLRGATSNQQVRSLDGKWVELTVGASAWSIREATDEEAAAFWEQNKPKPVSLPKLDLTVTGLHDIEQIVEEGKGTLREAIKKAVLAYGGKAAHYALLATTKNVPVRKAFAIPVSYYDQFMRDNGFYARIASLLADPEFQNDAKVRDAELSALRTDMKKGKVDEALQALLKDKISKEYPGGKMRFRTSTNSEDLDGFPCAGCYESHTGDPADWADVLDAIRKTWATVWLFRTFEERAYYGIDHTSVGMALLVHPNFPEEEANGVALTANPYDAAGLEPGYYVNVQWGGDAEVVAPPPGITSDEFLYFFDSPNRPITFLSHSNLVAEGNVLTARQTYDLGVALKAIHERFSPAYGPKAGNNGWYAMDVEFKFDDEGSGGAPKLFVKQARPHPGRGLDVEID